MNMRRLQFLCNVQQEGRIFCFQLMETAIATHYQQKDLKLSQLLSQSSEANAGLLSQFEHQVYSRAMGEAIQLFQGLILFRQGASAKWPMDEGSITQQKLKLAADRYAKLSPLLEIQDNHGLLADMFSGQAKFIANSEYETDQKKVKYFQNSKSYIVYTFILQTDTEYTRFDDFVIGFSDWLYNDRLLFPLEDKNKAPEEQQPSARKNPTAERMVSESTEKKPAIVPKERIAEKQYLKKQMEEEPYEPPGRHTYHQNKPSGNERNASPIVYNANRTQTVQHMAMPNLKPIGRGSQNDLHREVQKRPQIYDPYQQEHPKMPAAPDMAAPKQEKKPTKEEQIKKILTKLSDSFENVEKRYRYLDEIRQQIEILKKYEQQTDRMFKK